MTSTPGKPLRGALVSAVTVVLLAAGCGSSGTGKTKSTPAAPSSSTTATAVQNITRNWETFFSKTSTVPQKVALLQSGQGMQAAVNAFSNDPRMAQTTAKVTSVQPTGTVATVRYQVLVNNQVMLANATGQAVLEGGTWKVSDQTLCGLLSLAASPGVKIPGCS